MAAEGRLFSGFAWAGSAASGALLLAMSLFSVHSPDLDRSARPSRNDSRVLQAESQQKLSVLSEDVPARRELVPVPESRVLRRRWTNVRGPKKEKEFYSAFLRLAKNFDGSLERETELSLKGKGPDCEKVAALRALYDGKSARAPELFLYAIQNLSDGSRRQQEAIPSFAVRFLSKKAACDPNARGVLEKLISMEREELPGGFRRLASVTLARHGSEVELYRLVSNLTREKDDLLKQETLAALSENANQACANRLLALFVDLDSRLADGQNVGE